MHLSFGHDLLEHLGPAGRSLGNFAGEINSGSPETMRCTDSSAGDNS